MLVKANFYFMSEKKEKLFKTRQPFWSICPEFTSPPVSKFILDIRTQVYFKQIIKDYLVAIRI